MKRLFILSLTVLLVMWSAPLRGQVFVGYCTETVSSKGLSNSNLTATISCAAAFPSSARFFDLYQHCDLGAIRVGLCTTDGLSSFRVWVREHLASENLTEVEVPVEQLVDGWNDIALPDVFPINAYDTLYCGYSFTQTKKSAAISYSGKKNTKNSFFIAVNDRWGSYSSQYAPVSICAGIVGRKDNGAAFSSVRLDRRCQPFVADGSAYQPIVIEGTVQNLGKQPLSRFVLTWADNDQPAVSTSISLTESVPFGQFSSFSCELLPGGGVMAPTVDIPLHFSLQQPNDDAEALVVDPERTLYYDLYDASRQPSSFVHVIEEFSSEHSGFAPLGQQRLREALQDVSASGTYDYVILSHHEGFGSADAWRVAKGSDFMATLFGTDSLRFAPAAMVDRQGVPFSTTLSADSLSMLLTSTSTPSFATITADADVSDGQVTAQVTVQPYALTFCQNPMLVLCLVQDSVASVSQKNYYPELCSADYQRDVIRCFLHNKSKSDAMLQDIDMTAVMDGSISLSSVHAALAESGSFSYSYVGDLPAGLSDLHGLTLVAYICDRGVTNRIFASFVRRL